jgi:putative phosphoribosyl transferase
VSGSIDDVVGGPDRRFADRADAGAALAERLVGLELRRPLVVGLARGGVPVAVAAAARLGGEVVPGVTRKIVRADRPEAGLGAIGTVGDPVWFDLALDQAGLTPGKLGREVEKARAEARRREKAYGASWRTRAPGRDVVLVDDGIATGVTVLAGVRALEAVGPARLVVGTPVAAPSALLRLRASWGGPVVAVTVPRGFRVVSHYYDDFEQLTDADVRRALRGC